MFRISDIITKKSKEEKNKDVTLKPVEPREIVEEPRRFSISSGFSSPQPTGASLGSAAELYQALLVKARKIYGPDYKFESGFLLQISSLVENAIDLLGSNRESLMKFFFTDYPMATDYLFYHSVNVCILSLEIGRALQYERSSLIELGIAAFMHDIGMVQYNDLINKAEYLSDEEYQKIKRHPQLGFDILKNLTQESVPPIIIDAVLREHERLDGSGYPEGLHGDQIPIYAKIIGLVDMYEAQVHPRVFRRKFTPLESLKEMIVYKSAFDPKLIRVLISCIGVFPVGTIVRLNTKEAGVVVNNNIESPFRPVVVIKYDADGKELQESKTVDLSRNTVLFIEQSLSSFVEKPQNGNQ